MTQQRVFLSYAREDVARAEEIESVLIRDGHSVWRDVGQIDGGDLWRERIVSALKTSDVMVVLVSSNSTSSMPVLRELTLASEYGLRVVPVLLEPAEIPPAWEFQLAGIHMVDLPAVGLHEVREAVGGPLSEDGTEDPATGAGPPPNADPTAELPIEPVPVREGSSPDRAETEVLGLVELSPDAGPASPPPAAPGVSPASPPEPTGSHRPAQGGLPRWLLVAGGLAVVLIVIAVATSGREEPPDQTAATVAAMPCTPVSPLACDQVFVDSVDLDFDGEAGGLADAGGIGTGFTSAATTATGAGYSASGLQVAGGQLQITTGAGTAFADNNTLTNALGVALTPGSHEITTTLSDTPAFTRGNEHAGVWLYVDQDIYVKVNVVGAGSGDTILQAFYEVDGATVDEARIAGVPPGSTVVMRIEIDADSSTVTASGGFGADAPAADSAVQLLATFDADERLLGSATLDGEPVVFAGIFASHRNATAPITVTFEDFSAR